MNRCKQTRWVTGGISVEECELIGKYISAFHNLYGVIPLHKALEIIRQQNPELKMTDAQFYEFTVKNEFLHCIIVGAEEFDEDFEASDPENREIVSEYLYSLGSDSYFELKSKIDPDMPFFVPEKEELLKFEDEFYFEITPSYESFLALLQDDLRLTRAEDIATDLWLCAHMSDGDLQSPLQELEFKQYTNFDGFESTEQAGRFFLAYTDLFNNTRKHEYRGHTPLEVGRELKGQEVVRDVPMKAVVKKRKIGRNELCPCGSGKKFKKCCIDKGIFD